jgi:CHASE2 domain-containing sensor protein
MRTAILLLCALCALCGVILFGCQIGKQDPNSNPDLTITPADDANSIAGKIEQHANQLESDNWQAKYKESVGGASGLLIYLIGGIVGGLILYRFFPGIGSGIAAACGAGIVVILAVCYLPFWVAVIGLPILAVAALTGLGILGVEFIKRIRALKEYVTGSNQSPSTQKIVAKILEKNHGRDQSQQKMV